MTLKQLVVQWNDQWKYDLWFRRKYQLRFNDEIHRSCNQIDIAFEYIEYQLEQQERQKWDKAQRDRDYRQGDDDKWIRSNEDDSKAVEEAFDKLDLSKL